jgi:N-acetylglucosaminyldiphosphoundecaprenol N-acetyl-beta-D-mannosaminyltransferase
VGFAYNLLGARPRAPKALRTLGLGWLVRLAQEPQRLWKRYLLTVDQHSQFIYLVLKELLRVATGVVET